MKYFKKIYSNGRIACGCWNDGDGINYNHTEKYSIDWITKEEYYEIAKKINNYDKKINIEKELIKYKKEKYILEQIGEDIAEIDNKIIALELERDEITV